MNILITGNMGYIGPTLVSALRARIADLHITGFDAGYFAHCLTGARILPETGIDMQLFGDMRDFPEEVLDRIDAVIHLAAVSNDPMGKKYEMVTEEINHISSSNLAEAAKRRGVKHFVFASSCSIYGFAEGGRRKEDDALNPLTAYARSKVATEKDLQTLASNNFTVTCLRFATACGASDRLRLDLVLNDFVASAIVNGKIEVLSDGTPWRPLITVADMALAMTWATLRNSNNGGKFLAVNAGANEWNYQVIELADAVAQEIPGTTVSINLHAAADRRSYRVSFDLFKKLAPDYVPRVDLITAIRELHDKLKSMDFSDGQFRESNLIRLNTLNQHIVQERLNPSLRWINPQSSKKTEVSELTDRKEPAQI